MGVLNVWFHTELPVFSQVNTAYYDNAANKNLERKKL